jgi:hypothetical protein
MTDRIDTAALRDAMEAEREAFEAWARGEDSFRLHRPRGSCSYDDSTSQSAWEAWQARSSLDALRAQAAPLGVKEPAAPRYYCNKCGSFPDAVQHNRPDGSECPYIARVAAGVEVPRG